MDMKQKLHDAYKPDSVGRKKRIVVGLSGGIDSMVTAYLLKIQKYELIGVTVVNSWDNYQGNQSDTLSCLVTPEKIEMIHEFCQQLGIPHQVVKSSNEFQEEVVEGWVASRMVGTLYKPCWNCHGLRMRILYEKMLQLGADTIATGHFAKLYYHEQSKSVSVHTANDELNDQSALLSRLPNDILISLMLPLSDLQKKEVIKLSENFGLSSLDKKVKMHQCFTDGPEALKYLEEKIPGKYKATGEILDKEAANKFGDHTGVYRHVYGGTIDTLMQRNISLLLSKYSISDKILTVDHEDSFKKTKIILLNCETPEDTSWPEPFKAVIQLGENFVDCWVYPKSLKATFVEWEGPYKVLEGDIVSVYKKKGKNSKVFFTGMVRHLPPEPIVELEDKNVKKSDHSRDL